MITHLPKLLREKFFCDQCDYVSISIGCIRSHKKYDHDTEGEKYKCHCGKVFTKAGLLSAHNKSIHVNEKKHICTICPKAYSTSSDLKVCILMQKCEYLIIHVIIY